MRYRHTTREQMVKEFKQVKDNPQVIDINFKIWYKFYLWTLNRMLDLAAAVARIFSVPIDNKRK